MTPAIFIVGNKDAGDQFIAGVLATGDKTVGMNISLTAS
jgi:hypothetical protein